MARPLRIEYPGAFYHIISRGNAGEAIYKTRRDREKFLEYLATAAERFGLQIHAYCLMTNHFLCGAPHNIITYWLKHRNPI